MGITRSEFLAQPNNQSEIAFKGRPASSPGSCQYAGAMTPLVHLALARITRPGMTICLVARASSLFFAVVVWCVLRECALRTRFIPIAIPSPPGLSHMAFLSLFVMARNSGPSSFRATTTPVNAGTKALRAGQHSLDGPLLRAMTPKRGSYAIALPLRGRGTFWHPHAHTSVRAKKGSTSV